MLHKPFVAQAIYAGAITTDVWYHVAGVREGNRLDVYVNGLSGISDSQTLGTITPNSLRIGALGAFGEPPGVPFDGTIDDVRIYDRALSGGEVELVYQQGYQQGLGDSVGSLVGWLKHGSISVCYTEGSSVSGNDYVGGLVGKNSGSITNCYATGSTEGVGKVGGLVGENSNGGISNCYSTGRVAADSNVGGLVGSNSAGTVTDSFWDVQTSECLVSDGGTGLTTVAMQMAIVYTSAGWDFVGETDNGVWDIWRLCNEGTEYPQLNFQFPAGDFGCPDGVDMSDAALLCDQWLFYEIPDDVLPDGGDGIVNFFDWTVFADGWLAENDMYDLAEFVSQWLKTGQSYLITDIAPYSGDGIVNMADFAVVADNWLAGI
jgi:hypothetical protein